MTQKEFNEKADAAIRSFFPDFEITTVAPVWYAYILGNVKGLYAIFTERGITGFYVEVTYSVSRNDFQMDVYYKRDHVTL